MGVNTQRIEQKIDEKWFPNQLKLFINGEFVDAQSGNTFPVINPVDGSELCKVAEGDKEDIDKAVTAAENALQGEWKDMGAKGRQNLLLKFGELWKDRVADLAKLESLNNGTAVSLQSAVIEGLLNEIKYHSGWCDKIDGRVAGVDSNYHVYTTYEPIGVCGLVIAWNLPLWCIIVKMIPCLAMGNTCIIKPAEQTPLTALKLAEMLNEVGFPPGVVNIIPGYGPTAGSALAHHMKVRKIAFTGSTEVGRLMIKASADSNLKQVQLELGGKSPLIIFPDVNVDEAVEIASYVFCNNGQVCDSCSRTFVHEDIYDEFVQKAIEKARALKVGDPLDTTTDIGPLVCAEQYDRVRSYIELAQREGANIAYGGRDLSKEVYDGKGYFVEPTIFTNVTEDMTIFKEEIFGPCQTIIKFSDHKQVLESANNTQYGLAGGVISSNIANIFSITRNLKAGTVWGNCYATCMPEAEFGGVKHSGFGREGGPTAISEWSQLKTVCVKIPNLL